MRQIIRNYFYIFLSVLILSFFLIQTLSTKINPILYNYVNLEAERITTNIVDGSVNEVLSDNLNNDLFIIKKDSNGQIQTIDYNTKEVNNLLKKISNSIQKKLISLEDGNTNDFMISNTFKGKNFKYINNGIVCEIPMGALSGNGFLSNVGPIIPIKMSFLGQINCSLKTRVTNYGINNLYLEISVIVDVKERVTMPKMSKDKIITIKAPLSIKILQGTVPEYYGGIITENSKLFSFSNNN